MKSLQQHQSSSTQRGLAREEGRANKAAATVQLNMRGHVKASQWRCQEMQAGAFSQRQDGLVVVVQVAAKRFAVEHGHHVANVDGVQKEELRSNKRMPIA